MIYVGTYRVTYYRWIDDDNCSSHTERNCSKAKVKSLINYAKEINNHIRVYQQFSPYDKVFDDVHKIDKLPF